MGLVGGILRFEGHKGYELGEVLNALWVGELGGGDAFGGWVGSIGSGCGGCDFRFLSANFIEDVFGILEGKRGGVGTA